ncbi:MAG TPA: zinc-ribbon and DUF3426 domain-containing protein [Usitatibacteraceae bacterium]|nr:zinc-ribbon and DUF3426 domain-containing protein [Usitatibacteraceae bacterium]
MLVTACRHCGARFRVTPEQLNLRQGQVRCGQCHQVFNGFESLERFPGDDTGARLLAARAANGTHPDPVAELDDADLGRPVEHAVPSGQPPFLDSLPQEASPVPVGPPDSSGLIDVPDLLPESSVSKEVLLEAPSEGRSGGPPEMPSEALPEAPYKTAARVPPVVVTAQSVRRAQLARDGAFVADPAARPSRAWAFGVALLALVLALQLAYAFRAPIAQQYPVLRPILESACAAAGCSVPWVNDEAALKLEDSELLEVPGKPGQIALQARIRNLGTSAQEFPHLELTLTDATGQTAVRRVLRPADYLGRVPAAGEVMAAGSEALLSVRLETGRIRPTGYELLLFYP